MGSLTCKGRMSHLHGTSMLRPIRGTNFCSTAPTGDVVILSIAAIDAPL